MVTESSLDLKRVIDMLKKEKGLEYPDWREIEEDGNRFMRKDEFSCKLDWQKVSLHEMDAQEFLSFAKQDLEEDSERGRVNALSNAKRAIECRSDEILALWNLKGFASQKRWGFPYKLQVLRTFGVVAPDVLKKMVTEERNELEHEYRSPKDYGEIKNRIDIAELFLRATDAEVKRGYIASATVVITAWHEESRDKRFAYYWGWGDRVDLTFNLEDETLGLLYSGEEVSRQRALRLGRGLQLFADSVMDRKTTEEQVGVIHSCAMEDVKELMALLRKRPNESI